MTEESCVVSRLERFIELSDAEIRFLAEFERDERRVSAGDVLAESGDLPTDLFAVKQGWVVARSRRARGRSNILRIYLQGDIVGLAELGPTTSPHRLQMQTDGVVCPFPRARMGELYVAHPRLAALFTALSSIDQWSLCERIFALSSLTAEERLIQFLLWLHEALKIAHGINGTRFLLPFSQSELGDILGLTAVYVNKLLAKLRTEGRIEVDRPYIRLADPDAMAAEVKFVSPYRDLDTSWFPKAR